LHEGKLPAHLRGLLWISNLALSPDTAQRRR